MDGQLLKALIIPDGVTSIGEYTFSGCSGLTSITIPNGVTSIGSYAFSDCSGLTSITIPNGVTSIGSGAFSDCSGLASITIPDGVTSIGNGAFSGCSGLTSIVIPDGVTSIGSSAFYETKIKDVNIASIEQWMKITSDGNRFGLSSYNLIVNGLKLTNLVIPENITTIGMYTFYGCTSLESITFHKNVSTIVQNAFNGCVNVKKIVCQSDTPPSCGADALKGISRTDCVLYVPDTSGSNYQNTAPWSEFTNIVGGGTETPDTPGTCETPTITFDNNTKQLKFESATEGAEYHYAISSEDMATDGQSNDGVAQMTGVYTVTAYASADGMYNSEKATAKLLWVNAVIDASTTDVLSAKTQRGVIVSANGGAICISGTVGGEAIEVYNAAGSLLRSVKAAEDTTTIGGLTTGSAYVVKIGGTSVKVVLAD